LPSPLLHPVLLLLVSFPAHAGEIVVPDDHPTIQAAIDAAVDGDVIRVKAGTYFEHIDFLGKSIVVESVDGPAVTTIDANGSGSVTTFVNGEQPSTVLRGFTLTRGNGLGSAVNCMGASPTLEGNRITLNYARAVWCEVSDAVIRDNEITDNVDEGIFLRFSNAIVENNVISGNDVGLYMRESTALVVGNVIADNLGGWGGGIYITETSTPLVANNVIQGNNATVGGGLAILNGSDVLLVDNTIEGNFSTVGSQRGGGLFVQDASVTALRNTILGNHAEEGGGIYLGSNAGGLWEHNRIEGNSAILGGGGLLCEADPAPVVRNNFIGFNQAWRGGGVYLRAATPLELIGCEIVWNDADQGAGLFAAASSAGRVTHCTMLGNVAALSGGAIETNRNGSALIKNSIIWADFAPLGPEIHDTTGKITASWSLIFKGWPGTGVFDANPSFVDLPAGDYRLAAASPGIDAGDPSDTPAGFDPRGVPRFLDGDLDTIQRVDVGAHEFTNVTLDSGGRVSAGDSVLVLAKGTAGLPSFVALGFGTIELQLAPYGPLLLDPLKPIILGLSGATLPLSVVLTIPSPYTGPGTTYLQALILDPSTGAGNLSNLSLIEVNP
jgi:parallel beta-helix repeat protein